MKVPRGELDKMAADTALEYVVLQPYYQKYAYNKNVVDVNFKAEKS